jgi:hypothetical protein
MPTGHKASLDTLTVDLSSEANTPNREGGNEKNPYAEPPRKGYH